MGQPEAVHGGPAGANFQLTRAHTFVDAMRPSSDAVRRAIAAVPRGDDADCAACGAVCAADGKDCYDHLFPDLLKPCRDNDPSAMAVHRILRSCPVTPRLILASYAALDRDDTPLLLAASGVTHVLSVGARTPAVLRAAAAAGSEGNGGRNGGRIQIMRVEMADDDVDCRETLLAAHRLLSGALLAPDAVVVVHCFAASSRSVAVLAAHLALSGVCASAEAAFQMLESVVPWRLEVGGFFQACAAMAVEEHGSRAVAMGGATVTQAAARFRPTGAAGFRIAAVLCVCALGLLVRMSYAWGSLGA